MVYAVVIVVILFVCHGSGRGRSGTRGGRSSECFFWVLPKRSISAPDKHKKDIITQESLSTDIITYQCSTTLAL